MQKFRAEKISPDVGIGCLSIWEQMARPRVLTWSWPHLLGPALCPSVVVGVGQGLCPPADQIGGETGKETGQV